VCVCVCVRVRARPYLRDFSGRDFALLSNNIPGCAKGISFRSIGTPLRASRAFSASPMKYRDINLFTGSFDRGVPLECPCFKKNGPFRGRGATRSMTKRGRRIRGCGSRARKITCQVRSREWGNRGDSCIFARPRASDARVLVRRTGRSGRDPQQVPPCLSYTQECPATGNLVVNDAWPRDCSSAAEGRPTNGRQNTRGLFTSHASNPVRYDDDRAKLPRDEGRNEIVSA